MSCLVKLAILVIMTCAIVCTFSLLHIEKGMDFLFNEFMKKAEFAIREHQQKEAE